VKATATRERRVTRARSVSVRSAIVAAFATSCTGACGLPLAAEETPTENVCANEGDCGDGVCVTVGEINRCVATTTDLAGIVFQLEGTTIGGTRVSHVFERGLSLQGTRAEGVVVGLDLDVPEPLLLSGKFVHPSSGDAGACAASDGSVAVTVEARTTAPLVGLEQVFTGTSTPVIDAAGATSHRFQVPVAPGTYDVYVVPQALDGCVPLPPRIFPGIDVESDVELEPEPEEPRRLTGVVVPGGGLTLDGFRVELLEPKRGLPVSEPARLAPIDGGSPLLGGPDGTDERGIAYYYTEGLVLRLSDASDRLVVHWKFSALDFDGDGDVRIDLADLITDQKRFRARVVDGDTVPVAGASVTIKSLTLTGEAGKNSSFRVAAQSDATGIVEVDLVPGTYQVVVVPPSEEGADERGPAQLQDEWEIKPDSQCCGRTFVLGERPVLTGSVRTAAGDVVPSLPVVAAPTLSAARDYFARALGGLDVLPRQGATTTDPSGLFAMPVDAGTYDVTIRLPIGTGYPWLVLPATVVAPAMQQPGAPLGTLSLPSPAIVVGRATLETDAGAETVARAILRAYLPLVGDEGGAPARVVAIGEGITDDEGRFELPLPPTIARAAAGRPGDPLGAGGAPAP
jgi:hypothetical protein